MWCNHDPIYVHPAGKHTGSTPLLSADLTVQSFYEGSQYCIDHYMNKPNYLRNSDGRIYFCIYLTQKLMANFGGPDGVRIVLNDFRTRVHDAGLGDLDISAIAESSKYFSDDTAKCTALMKYMGFDSFSSHGLRGVCDDMPFPHRKYNSMVCRNIEVFGEYTEKCGDMPFNINIHAGLDTGPRTVQSESYGDYGSFFMRIVNDNTPELFEKLCRAAKDFYYQKATGEYITVYSWNEWSEGGYLEAIKRVFNDEG